jgi:hypothetical protein
MSTPAERIYEAAAGNLADQQATVARLTSAVAPVGAFATAGAVLFKPATNGIADAQWPQIAGLVAGLIGLLLMCREGYRLQLRANIEGVPPELLYSVAKASGSLAESEPFHLAAAADLKTVFDENKPDIGRFRRWFTILVIGLMLELVGLGAASLIRPNPTSPATPAPVSASLHLTGGHLNRREMSLVGELAAGAHGRVRIAVGLLGRAGEVLSLHPSIHGGRFRARVRVLSNIAPLRSASYAITWAGSNAVAGAYLSGTIARCSGDCR